MNMEAGKAAPTCRRRLKGRQSLNVLLFRKELKKSGQAWEVKLLPIFVSKGLGIAELVPEICAVNVEDAAEDDVVVAVSELTIMAEDDPPADDNAVEAVAETMPAEDELVAAMDNDTEVEDVVEAPNGSPLP